jgi:hypothetical protein
VTDYEVVRELIGWCPDVVGTHPTRKDEAYRALDRLVAERDRFRLNAEESVQTLRSLCRLWFAQNTEGVS